MKVEPVGEVSLTTYETNVMELTYDLPHLREHRMYGHVSVPPKYVLRLGWVQITMDQREYEGLIRLLNDVNEASELMGTFEHGGYTYETTRRRKRGAGHSAER